MTRKHWVIIGALGTLFVIIICALQWWKYSHFGYSGIDLGIYSQVVWNLAHGHGFASSIHDPSYLGDHLELWLVPISWIYRLWNSPLMLLWLQTLIIASTIIPLAKLSARYLNSRAAIVVSILFFVNPLIYNVSLYEFHGLVVALPILMWSIWYYHEKHFNLWIISLIALLLVREDMPLLVAGWAIMATVDKRNWKWWLPPVILAITWFSLAQQIIRAANHDGLYKYQAFYRWLGERPRDMLFYPFLHPILFLEHILTFNNLGTILGLLAAGGFLMLLRPKKLWPLIIIFLTLVLGNAQPGSFLHIHYSVPYLPFIFWAGLETWRDIWQGNIKIKKISVENFKIIAVILLIAGPLYASLIFGQLEWPWNKKFEPPTAPMLYQQAIKNIQPQDRVLTTFALLPNLANRQTLYSLNYLYLGRRQYSEIPYKIPTDIDVAVIDWQQLYDYQFIYKTTVFQNRDGLQRINDFLTQQDLGVVKQYGSITIYRRGGTPDTAVVPYAPLGKTADTLSVRGERNVKVVNNVKLPVEPSIGPLVETLNTFKPVVPPVNPPVETLDTFSVQGDARVTLVKNPLGWRDLIVATNWTAKDTKQDSPISILYTLRQNNKIIWSQPQILGQGPNPSSEWPKNSAWTVRDILALPKNIAGTATLEAEIFIPSGNYTFDRLRSFRAVINSKKTLGTISLGTIDLGH